MHLAAQVFAAILLVNFAAAASWSYAAQSDWNTVAALCGSGVAQSPIAIDSTSLATPTESFSKIRLSDSCTFDNTTMRKNNTRATIIVEFVSEIPCTMDDPQSGDTLVLQNVELHLKSEHPIDGVQSNASALLYFAAASGKRRIVAVRLNNDGTNSSTDAATAYRELFSNLPRVEDESISAPPTVNVSGLTFDALLPASDDRGYITYTGSVPYPPCTESVRWYILESPVSIMMGSLVEYRAALSAAYPDFADGNVRDTQPMNNRTVYRVPSSGVDSGVSKTLPAGNATDKSTTQEIPDNRQRTETVVITPPPANATPAPTINGEDRIDQDYQYMAVAVLDISITQFTVNIDNFAAVYIRPALLRKELTNKVLLLDYCGISEAQATAAAFASVSCSGFTDVPLPKTWIKFTIDGSRGHANFTAPNLIIDNIPNIGRGGADGQTFLYTTTELVAPIPSDPPGLISRGADTAGPLGVVLFFIVIACLLCCCVYFLRSYCMKKDAGAGGSPGGASPASPSGAVGVPVDSVPPRPGQAEEMVSVGPSPAAPAPPPPAPAPAAAPVASSAPPVNPPPAPAPATKNADADQIDY